MKTLSHYVLLNYFTKIQLHIRLLNLTFFIDFQIRFHFKNIVLIKKIIQ